MATTRLIAVRVFSHRGKRVATGDVLDVTSSEARALLDRRLARRSNATDGVARVPAVATPAPAPAAPPAATAPPTPMCTATQHVWPDRAVTGSKCLCRRKRLNVPDVPASAPTPSATRADDAPTLTPTPSPADVLQSSQNVERASDARSGDLDQRSDDDAAATEAQRTDAAADA